MARIIELCSNFECEHKYWCKRYCTISHENYKEAINLKDECNKANDYALYRNWKNQ